MKVTSCLTFCDPMDCSLPGSSIDGIFQARVLEWVDISFSRESFPPRDQTWVSRIVSKSFTFLAIREVLWAGEDQKAASQTTSVSICSSTPPWGRADSPDDQGQSPLLAWWSPLFCQLLSLFLYFLSCWVFVAAGVSPAVMSRLLSLGTTDSRVPRLQEPQHLGSVVAAPSLWSTGSMVVVVGLTAVRHVGSSRMGDQTRVPRTGRWVLNHWTKLWFFQWSCMDVRVGL